jgi:hypothetical protein
MPIYMKKNPKITKCCKKSIFCLHTLIFFINNFGINNFGINFDTHIQNSVMAIGLSVKPEWSIPIQNFGLFVRYIAEQCRHFSK